MSKYIEIYVRKVNPMKAPQVAAALLDAYCCSKDFVRALILSVRPMAPSEQLVEEVEPWLEARVNEDVREAAVHKALMKTYIDMNNRPEEYLTTNIYYDSNVVGEYNENRDPQLSSSPTSAACATTSSSMSPTATGCTSSTRATSSSGPPLGPRC